MLVSPIVNYPAGGVMFIDADLRAMIVARFELVGTEETPGVPDTPAGLAAARSSALRGRPRRTAAFGAGAVVDVTCSGTSSA